MSYADQLYLMQLDFQKQAQARRDAVERDFQALRDEEHRRNRELRALYGQGDEDPSEVAWEANELQIYYDEGDED